MYVSYLDDREVIKSHEFENIIIENLGVHVRIVFKGYTKCLERELNSTHRAESVYNEMVYNFSSRYCDILMNYQLDQYELEYLLFDTGIIEINKIYKDFDEYSDMCVGEFKMCQLEDSLTMYDLCVKYI